MKLTQRLANFTVNKLIPAAAIIGGLIGVDYFCFSEHRLENSIVQESEADCGTESETWETVCWEEIEVHNHWKCLYLAHGHLEPSTKLEYLKWNRGFRPPLLDCDRIIEYKISGEERIYR